jgi:hypothetical protein
MEKKKTGSMHEMSECAARWHRPARPRAGAISARGPLIQYQSRKITPQEISLQRARTETVLAALATERLVT